MTAKFFVYIIISSAFLLLGCATISYPKASEDAKKMIALKSNIEKTEFFIDGKSVVKGKIATVLVNNTPHTIIARPEGYTEKEYYIQPPYETNNLYSFYFMIGDRSAAQEQSAAEMLKNVDVKAAVSAGVSPVELQKIKRVAVSFGGSKNSDLADIMADNIALELMNLGFQVIERADLEKVLSEQKLQMSGLLDSSTAAKIGKMVGVDAVVLGSMTTIRKETGSGTYITVISNATARVVGVEKADVLMMVTISYREGQTPTEATKTMAVALADKLKGVGK